MRRYTVGMCHVSKICRFLTCNMLFHHPFPNFIVFSIVQFKYFLCCCTKLLGSSLTLLDFYTMRSQGAENAKCFGFSICFIRFSGESIFLISTASTFFGNAVDTEVLCWFSFGQHSQQPKNPSDADESQLRGCGASGLELCHQGGLPKCGAFASNAGASRADGERWTCCFGAWAMLKPLFSTPSSCKGFVCKHRPCDNEV